LLFTIRSYCSRSRREADRKAASCGTIATPLAATPSPAATAADGRHTATTHASDAAARNRRERRRRLASDWRSGGTIGWILFLVGGNSAL
jgi:hypothetical protein